MVEGELLALQRLGAIELTSEEYFRIIDRKTAHLFSAACSVPALIAPRSPGAEPALAAYGRNLGLCFQIVDDLLDFTARQEELGKPVLSDLKEGKLTLPLILLLPRVGEKRRGAIAHVLEDGGFERTAAQEILDLVHAEGTLEEAREIAEGHAEKARQALDDFPVSAERDALEYAPDYVLDRRA
jgi:octaprenyl-diphosphate synthase